MGQKSRKRRWIVGGCPAVIAIGLVAAVGIGWLLLSHDSPINRASAIKATKEWARLADLPSTKSNLRIETSGSSFTRTFTLSFRDSPAAVRAWIALSPGPASVAPSTDSSGRQIYTYPAGGGATFSEVRVSPSGDEVHIEASWS